MDEKKPGDVTKQVRPFLTFVLTGALVTRCFQKQRTVQENYGDGYKRAGENGAGRTL